MKRVFLLATLMLLPATMRAARNDPSLPSWNEEERKQLEESGWVPGALLLADDPPPEEQAKPEANPLDAEKPTPEEIAEAAAEPTTEIREKYLTAYFDQRPESFLIDPQNLLDSRDSRDRAAFLTSHAGDSAIDLFVYVFGKDQEIPGEVREEELIERFFSTGRPAMIVYYYLGQPQRSMVYLSPSLTDTVSAAEQRRALTSSVMQALEKADPAGQLEAFVVQLGIRIYWMERMIHGEPSPEESTVRRATVHAAKKLKQGPSLGERMAGIMPVIRPYFLPAGGLLAALGIATGALWWWKRRATFRLPELEVEPRLGGDHAAGVGAVISFASPTLPPASQRQQVPDYLRPS